MMKSLNKISLQARRRTSALVVASVCLLLAAAVFSTKTNAQTQVDLGKVSSTVKTIPLSAFVENCTILNLDNRDEALVGSGFTTITDKYIGVRQNNKKPYKLFDRSGKFLCDVGGIGQGPGEYAFTLYDDLIDDKNDLVYLIPMRTNKIFVYNTSGKFVREINYPETLNKPKLHLSNGILTVFHMAFPGNKAIAIQFDASGKVIKELVPPADLKAQDYNGEIFNTRNTDAFEFVHTSKSVLYHYNVKDNELVPVFTFKIGGDESKRPFCQYMELNNHYITFVFGKGLVCTDKKDNSSSYINVVNDFLGNLPVYFSVVSLRNGWYVINIEPAALIDQIDKYLTEGKPGEKDRQALQKLRSSLDDDANNVLVMGKLK
jgi:hypothetical protein